MLWRNSIWKTIGQVAIRSQGVEMKEGQPLQALAGIAELLEFGARQAHKSIERRVDGGHQDVFFALEVEIDGTIGDAGAVGHVGYARGEEAFLREDRHRRIQDSLILVGAAVHAGRGALGRSEARLRIAFCQESVRRIPEKVVVACHKLRLWPRDLRREPPNEYSFTLAFRRAACNRAYCKARRAELK